MQAGTLFYRVITRKLQGVSGAVQFILLAGFNSKLTTATCDYYETLSPGHTLCRSEIDRKVEQFCRHGNAGQTRDVTDGAVTRKLERLWDTTSTQANLSRLVNQGHQTFAGMRIGQYL